MANDTADPFTSPWPSNVTSVITWRTAILTVITLPLSVATIIGNILVMVAFNVNPRLRTVSNYFLLSLAVADLILGTVSMNLYTTYIIIGHWTLGNLACDVWLVVDYVASNASVMNLLAISFDRYLSITRPLTYRVSRTTRRAAVVIALAWGVSFLLWAPAILFWQDIVGNRTVPDDQCAVQFLSEPVITFGTAIAAFYLPVSVMVFLYWRVYQETERRSMQLAGLIASHGSDSNKSSQSQSSSSCESEVEKTNQTISRPKSEERSIRSLCPSVNHCMTTWRKRKDRYFSAQMQNRDVHSTEDDPKTAVNIPLAQVKTRLDALNDSDFDLDVDGSVSQSDSQQSLGQCLGSDLGSLSLPQVAEQQRRKPRSWSLIRQKKAARTLCAILLAFIFTWTPYNIMVLVSTFCESCVPEWLWQLGYWLCYVNSTVNPVCYALCNKQFRVTFKKLLLCRWEQRSRTP